jgi:hypothetical protein
LKGGRKKVKEGKEDTFDRGRKECILKEYWKERILNI